MSGILLILLALGAIVVSAYGHRINAQPGLLILIVGAGVSFIPHMPRLELEPELILGLVVPPLLYAAALEFSFLSFMRNLQSILGLGVFLVLVTAFFTQVTAHWMLPALGGAGAWVLSAIIAPPDTVTITAHGREVGLPRKVSAILVGESLVNDAAALTIFSLTLATATGTTTFLDNPILLFLYSAVAGVVIGMVLAQLVNWMRQRIGDPTLSTALGLVTPFAAYIAAEMAYASGVLAVVMAGFTVSMASTYSNEGANRVYALNFRTRLTEGEVWPVIGSLLEAFVFAYTGLQMHFVIDELRESGEPFGRTVLAGVVILLVVIAVRFAWVWLLFSRSVLSFYLTQLRIKRHPDFTERLEEYNKQRVARGKRPREIPQPLGWKESLLVSWTGMRGIVTLGAAGGIPLSTEIGHEFPHRTTIQFLAYFVVIGTLLLQGPSLPRLARWLKIDTTGEDREDAAELAKAKAIIEATEGGFDKQRVALSLAVRDHKINDEAARVAIAYLDRQESAAEPLAAAELPVAESRPTPAPYGSSLRR